MEGQDQYPIGDLFMLGGAARVGVVHHEGLMKAFGTDFIMVRTQASNANGLAQIIEFAGKPADMVALAGMILETARKITARHN